jgi:hypothetical protein
VAQAPSTSGFTASQSCAIDQGRRADSPGPLGIVEIEASRECAKPALSLRRESETLRRKEKHSRTEESEDPKMELELGNRATIDASISSSTLKPPGTYRSRPSWILQDLNYPSFVCNRIETIEPFMTPI